MKSTAVPPGARSLFAVILALLITLAFSSTALTASSAAHSGGKAIPLVREFTLTPSTSGWNATLTVVDFDGGEVLEAVAVQLKGAGMTKFTPMVESETAGTYQLALPKAEPGPVKLDLQMRTLPGGTEITNLNETYERTLVADKPLHVVGSAPQGESGGGSNAGMIVGGAGALLIVAVICTMLAVRSRPPATAAPGR